MVKKSKQQHQCAPTEKQKLRAEAKERARRWARDTLGGKSKATAVRKSENSISKEEAKARARKWAKERFGEGNDSDESDAEEDDEINSGFQKMNIVAYDEEVRSRDRRNNKADQPRKGYSKKYQSKPSTSSRNGGGNRERKEEHQRNSNWGFGATSAPSSATTSTSNEAPNRTTKDQYTKEQADIVDGVITASKSGRGSHYRVLKITSSASQDDIKKAYRRLALQIHPDKNLHPMSAEAFKVLGCSYDVLKSESKRARYDRRSNPTTSSNSSSRSGHRRRASGSHSHSYYGAREEHASSNSNSGHGFHNTAHNPFGPHPFGGPFRRGSTQAGRSDSGGAYYQSSSPFGDNSNPNEGSRRYF